MLYIYFVILTWVDKIVLMLSLSQLLSNSLTFICIQLNHVRCAMLEFEKYNAI